MDPESSPFRPGQPVPSEFFVGRVDEIERLRGMVRASAGGRFKIGFVSGERGIGKSSLAYFVRLLSEQESKLAACHVFLGGVRDLKEMLRRTFERLLKESVDKPWHEKIKSFFGDRVRKVGLFGITLELKLNDSDLSSIADDFVSAIVGLCDKLTDRSSILLILDDINGLATSDVFANWLKSMVDEIATSQKHVPLCILVVGLEERCQELVARQPSLARVFELTDITPWSDEEVIEFYRRSFEAGNAEIADDDLALLVRYTGGMPVLAHEIGEAVWRSAQSPKIDQGAITAGIVSAAEVIGRKLLEPQVFSAIRSERYRSILRKMADEPQTRRFRRSELAARLSDAEQKVLDNFLRRMKGLGALDVDPEVRGGYQFPNHLHALYFWMESERARRNA